MATGGSAQATGTLKMENAKYERLAVLGVLVQLGCGTESEQKKNKIVNTNDLTGYLLNTQFPPASIIPSTF